MKIIPLVLLLGATPVLAQGNAPASPQPAATPVKKSAAQAKPKAQSKAAEKKAAEQAKAEEKKKEEAPRRYERVSRRPARPARPVISRTEEAVAAKPEEKKAEPKKAAQKKAEARKAQAAKPQQAAEAAPKQKARSSRRAAAKPTPAPAAQESAEAKPKKKGGPFSFIGKMFGGGKKEEPAEEQTVMVGPPAPTPAARQQQARQAPSRQAVAEVDDEAYLPSYQPQRHQQQGPPVAVHRTVSDGSGGVVPVTLDDDLPTVEPRSSYQAPPPPRQQPVRSTAVAPQQQVIAVPQQAVAPAPTTFDRTRYQEVRKKAATDPQVAELGQKLNATAPGDAAHGPAAREYTMALFGKMRELDPEQGDWIDRMEAATVRRIDAGKPVFAD